MKPTFLWRGLCLFISLYNAVSMIAVCVFLCRTYNAVRIPHAINLSDRNSASSTDATFAVGDLQTAGDIYVRFIPTQFHSLFHYLPISVAEPSKMSDRVSTVVKVLRYKSEGRWFDSEWCHWNFSLT